ncbi:peptidyl-prolyl cis-trans isomerase FKBP4-like [Leptopilina boulardi]|uniref:peptidyl-prolyl cis-trans isomerase FKBP4-like n=1 Tax=Leptopilina boulardi TaxID=63433 RepID=UPI0021F5368E|nr:peptidyl-prolyl cis-trans isomerase FKBP4-like [Leptopilina boulardi]
MAVDISLEKDDGVLKEILKEGEGDELPSPGCTVKVHYTGTLLDGTKFDSSKDRNEPFSFELGEGRVIKAWEIGTATMKKGEVAVLTCAPKYAYGKGGSPPKIPPNATLKFEIEMLGWSGMDISPEKDGSIEKIQLRKGIDMTSPNDGALVNVHLVGKCEDRLFEERDVQFNLGEGEDVGVVKGVELALEKLKNGETARLKIKSKYAFGKSGKSEFNIPPDTDVVYEVELKSFEKTPDSWSMDNPQKIEQAKILKEKGTNYFKQNKFNIAIEMYRKINNYISYDKLFSDDSKIERDSILLATYLNLALCYLKIEQYNEAKEYCNKALEIDPSNEKALFRRGQAHLALASPEIAIKDFEQVVKIEPNNTAAVKQITACNNLKKKQLAAEKKLYSNIFDKFAAKDNHISEK